MSKVKVELAEQSYNIDIAANLLNSDSSRQLLPQSKQYAIISNQKVAELYLESVKKILPEQSSLTVCLIPDSETSKSPEQYLRLMDILLKENFNRSSTIIALGGGVVGDLAGFVAATLHRGCNLVQIPTSLLAQVDSSVGGKTAINHQTGKNLIGCFYQPKAVVIDPATLKTLDQRQFAAGMAEVIKYAFIQDDTFLQWLEDNAPAIKAFDMPILAEMISHCCKIKALVVSADEKETGQRVLLNFGHTFGHAIENVSGYGKWLHGEAVSVGMLMASKLAVDNQLMDEQYLKRLHSLLSYFDLPLSISTDFSSVELISLMYRDKKNLNQKLQLVLPRRPGLSELVVWRDESALISLLIEFGAGK
ncbi:MAG: 3-dehydroquinate synthase [Gammaproteobacteria bacterium]|nr:MAG: 3-dehydroquinate synthase [Gammaproteobacteria bacterium]